MGTQRKLDELGRIVIPKDCLGALGWSYKTPLDIELSADGQGIRVTPAAPTCGLCGGTGDLLHSGKYLICRACVVAAR